MSFAVMNLLIGLALIVLDRPADRDESYLLELPLDRWGIAVGSAGPGAEADVVGGGISQLETPGSNTTDAWAGVCALIYQV